MKLRTVLTLAAILSLASLGVVPAATAQIPSLPIPPELEDPLAGAIDTIGDGVVGAIGDIPLDNALQLLGSDGIDAAIALSKVTFQDGTAPVALLSRSTIFADSLSSGGAQGLVQAPLLVTAEDGLDERVAEELGRLGATNVIVLGNEKAISSAVVQQLEDLGLTVDRLGGPTRIETAIEIARGLMPDATQAIIARAYGDENGDESQAYVDSLAVGPWAASLDIPILLTQTDVLSGSLRDYLEESGITDVTVIGGESAVAPAVTDALEGMGIAWSRVSGPNRFATAVAIAVARGYLTVADFDRLILAEIDGRDDVWVAGFAAAANGGLFNGPVLLTNGLILPGETISYIVQGLPDNLTNVGGGPVICTSFVNIVACEAAALLMLGFLQEAETLLGDAGIPIQTIEEILGLGGGGGEPTEEPTEEPSGEPTEEPTEECLLPAPFPCVPPPA